MARRREYGIDEFMEYDGNPWNRESADSGSNDWQSPGMAPSEPSSEPAESPWSRDQWQTYQPLPPEAPPIEVPGQTRDTSSWDTNGYATPGYTAENYGDAPSGWDPQKWSNPNHQSPKYVVGRILQSVGDLKDPNNRNKAIQLIQQAYPGTTFDGKDKITVPGIGPVDIFTGASAGQYGIAWQDLTAAANEAAQQQQYAPGNTMGSMMGSLATQYSQPMQVAPTPTPAPAPVAAPAEGPPPGINDTLWQMLLSRAQQGTNINANDPIIQNQVDNYRAEAERARRNYISDNAESSSPYSTGAMEGVERMTAERLGQDVGGFESELIGRELQARRDEIQHALDSMSGLLTEQQRQALQKELAMMDNSLEAQRIGNQNSQFYAGLSQADRHFLSQLAQQGRLAEMDDAFRRMQLGQQNQQHLDNMGFQEADRSAYWDWLYRGNQP
jgi:hypothetical protein